MTDSDDLEAAFATHRAYEQDGAAFALTTTLFDARVTIDAPRDDPAATEASDSADSTGDTDDQSDEPRNSNAEPRYRVRVRVPTIDAATEERVADAVAAGWFDTFSLRVADAPGVTRADVDVPDPEVREVGTGVVVTCEFTHASPERAAAVAKTLAEYIEGTYAEGIVPGYTYESPVADLLSRARDQGATESGDSNDTNGDDANGGDTGGPMPL